mmetsp:Transcript_39798/g.78412  ORF Transcript_39798/g.78412 Transcript_39798/m.78412 type:complete len:264 (-) Transcript_39798:96-887(-)
MGVRVVEAQCGLVLLEGPGCLGLLAKHGGRHHGHPAATPRHFQRSEGAEEVRAAITVHGPHAVGSLPGHPHKAVRGAASYMYLRARFHQGFCGAGHPPLGPSKGKELPAEPRRPVPRVVSFLFCFRPTAVVGDERFVGKQPRKLFSRDRPNRLRQARYQLLKFGIQGFWERASFYVVKPWELVLPKHLLAIWEFGEQPRLAPSNVRAEPFKALKGWVGTPTWNGSVNLVPEAGRTPHGLVEFDCAAVARRIHRIGCSRSQTPR